MTEPQDLTHDARTAFWDLPWGWSQALLVQICLVAIAFAFQWRLNGMELPSPSAGLTVAFLLAFTAVSFLLGWRYRQAGELRWASGVPFGMTALILTGTLALMSTLFVQDIDALDMWTRLGLRHVFQSLPFLMASALLWFHLAALLGRRCASHRLTVPFALNHLGMLCVLFGGVAGSQLNTAGTLRMITGRSVNSVQTESQSDVPLGASITVTKHVNRHHEPILTLTKPKEQPQNALVVLGPLQSGATYTHLIGQERYTITVVRRPGTRLPPLTDDRHLEYVQCFQLRIRSKKHGERLEQIPAYLFPAPKAPVTRSSFEGLSTVIRGPDGRIIRVPLGVQPIPDDTSLPQANVRQRAQVFRFYAVTPRIEVRRGPLTDSRSYVDVVTDDGKRIHTDVAVNKPLKINGWTLFQNGGDLVFTGQHLVTFLARKDPAQPILLLGMLMVLAGSILAYAFRLNRSGCS